MTIYDLQKGRPILFWEANGVKRIFLDIKNGWNIFPDYQAH